MSAQALAVCCGLFVEAAGALYVPAKDRCCSYDAAAAALAANQAQVGEAGQRLAHDAPRDAELPRQLILGRE
ncbi:hypothetical protein NicSoilC5_04420 [Arthrobacter sp. NicSoilC5]|nr:hypothetical protein NicSoilC5_04420 [Arthrobacter sp. NicSoilC5]